MVGLYRVLPYLAGVPRGRAGHPLFVPRSTGANRVDNPGRYQTLYVGDSPAGAVAEAFGWAPRWDAGLFRGSPSLPGSGRALVAYELAETTDVCNLDDAGRLVDLGVKPSYVVTRDRSITQAWALRVFEQEAFAGVRWWSYYDPEWGSYGLWDCSRLAVKDVQLLTIAHPAVRAAAEVLVRPLG